MNGSVLYILPSSSNPSIINNEVSKTRSLSDLEMVLKTPSKDLHIDRRNTVSGPVPINNTLSTTAAVEGLFGPFKTLEEAQLAASLLKQKSGHIGLPVPGNSHVDLNNKKSISMSTRSKANLNDNLKLSITSCPKVASNNKAKECTGPKTVLAKRLRDNQVCSSASMILTDSPADSCTFLTSSLPSGSKCTAEMGSFKENSVSGPKICKTEPEDLSLNLNGLMWTKPLGDPQVCSEIQVNGCRSVTTTSQVLKLIPDCTKNCVLANVGNCQKSTKACAVETDNPAVKKIPPSRKKKNISSITKAASLVFFDLETTGLAFQIGKSNVQITEVSMIAISRREFEQSTFDDLRDIRIIQKLCLCTRPRSAVSYGAAAVTGLNDKNLMDQNPFEHSAAEAINHFLTHLPKPVCLLAHNGNNYDFPLLKAEFSRLDMSLPTDILIADTLKAFRALGVPVHPPEKKICKSVKYTKKGQVSYSLSNLHLYFFNKNPTGSHSSEGDCIALAKVCHRMKDVILPWVDENCSTFDSVSPMW